MTIHPRRLLPVLCAVLAIALLVPLSVAAYAAGDGSSEGVPEGVVGADREGALEEGGRTDGSEGDSQAALEGDGPKDGPGVDEGPAQEDQEAPLMESQASSPYVADPDLFVVFQKGTYNYSTRKWSYARIGEQATDADGNVTYQPDGCLRSSSSDTTVYVPLSLLEGYYGPYGFDYDPSSMPFYHKQGDSSAGAGNPLECSWEKIDGSVYLKATVESSTSRWLHLYFSSFTVKEDTVTPGSTVLNVFDYWLVDADRFAHDASGSASKSITSGINAGHALKFAKDVTNCGTASTSPGSSHYATQGIYSMVLGEDGYPALSGDTGLLMGSGNAACDFTESLAYLFDPAVQHAGKASFENVTGLLSVDRDGYYSYDSIANAARLDEETGRFTVYNEVAGRNSSYSGYSHGQFYPFNDPETVVAMNNTVSPINHYFGLTLTTRFQQQFGGRTQIDGDPMTFSFSGDNDTLVYIDGVLVGDLGGLGSYSELTLDFATGQVTVWEASDPSEASTTIRARFEKAGRADTVEWDGDTFADGTTHTLRLFYMERGNYDSNLRLKYNLATYPATSIYKVDQYGDAIEGAAFAAYPADGDWNLLDGVGGSPVDTEGAEFLGDGSVVGADGAVLCRAAYVGTTDAAGEMVFSDANGMPLTQSEVKGLLGERFLLREVSVPPGYRLVSSEARLSFDGSLLVAEDVYATGAVANPNALVTATPALTVAADAESQANAEALGLSRDAGTGAYRIGYYDPGTGASEGTLFAVVLKRGTAPLDLADLSQWDPVAGTDQGGYQVLGGGSQLARVLQAASEANVFSETTSGMQALVEDLPGDPTRYLSYMLERGVPMDATEPQYAVAYFWTSAEGLGLATAQNTVRVVSHGATVAEGAQSFVVAWGSKVSVPNVENRLIVQAHAYKEAGCEVDGTEESVAAPGRTVALYPAADDADGVPCYVASHGELVRLSCSESVSQARGTCERVADGAQGTWVADVATGTITCTFPDATDTIVPAKGAAGPLVAVTMDASDPRNPVDEDGTCVLTRILGGTYLLRQLDAPQGCAVPQDHSAVVVTGSEVLADAGSSSNAVTVGNGAGYLVKTLSNSASEGHIDETLTWMRALLKVYGTEGFSAFLADEGGLWAAAATTDLPYLADGSTDSLAGALVTYLSYDPESESSLFDYVASADQSARADGTGVGAGFKRIWTTTGWSRLVTFQDTVYGLAATSPDTRYDDLAGQDLSALFSNSTFVRLHAEPYAHMTVVKGLPGDDRARLDVDAPEVSGDVSEDVLWAEPDADGLVEDGDGDPSTVAVAWEVANDGLCDLVAVNLQDMTDKGPQGVPGRTCTLVRADGTELGCTLSPVGTVLLDGEPATLWPGDSVRGTVRVALCRAARSHSDTLEAEAVPVGPAGPLGAIVAKDPWSVAARAQEGAFDLVVSKVAMEDPSLGLPGAVFEVRSVDLEGLGDEAPSEGVTGELVGTVTSGEDGKGVLEGLPDGVYKLTETAAPDGCWLPGGSWWLQVGSGGAVLRAASDVPYGEASMDESEGVVTVTLRNVRWTTLPMTGTGFWWVLLLALALAGVAWWANRKGDDSRSES